MTKPSRPPDADKLGYHYHQSSRFRWYGDFTIGWIGHSFGWSAFTERGIRRKLARQIIRHRRSEQMMARTERRST